MKKTTAAEAGSGGKMAIGLAALGVAAVAGTYFLYGSKNAGKNRKHVKAWSVKAKGEILERLEDMKEVNEKVYHKVVSEVAAHYKKLKKLEAADVVEFVDELKGHWKDIAKEIKKKA